MLLNSKETNEENTIKNEYSVIALVSVILGISCLLFPKTETTFYVMSVLLCSSILFSFVGIAISFKIDDFTGESKGLKLSSICFIFSLIIYALPFVLNALS